MIKKNRIYLILFGVFVITSMLLGWSQIINAEDPPYYCPDPQSYSYNNDCISPCGWNDVKACYLVGGYFECCPYEEGGWYCGCIQD